MSLSEEELKRLADAMMHTTNAIGIDDFDGFSPSEMQEIIYNPLSGQCPIQLAEDISAYQHIPLLNQILYILTRIGDAGKIKLTITGKLPVLLVADIYAQRFIPDDHIERGLYKLYKEEDALSIHLAHILLQLTGCVRKSKGYLYLSKKGMSLLDKPGKLLKELLLAFGQKFNWSYFDGYGQQPIGNIGWLYSIYLVTKYGGTTRPVSFYAEKYFNAFSALIHMIESGDPVSCYSIRSFDRFMILLGLITAQKKDDFDLLQEIQATPVLNKLFEITKPNNYQRGGLN